jgi:protoporphyrinogen oxidase
MSDQITILGAGLAGISTSYHIGHKRCIVFEVKSYIGGHIYSHKKNGYTWDEGPHVSFTKHQYVKKLFEDSLEGVFLEFKVFPTNYFNNNWIPHPAQTNLYAVPEPLRSECLQSFLETRDKIEKPLIAKNYAQWLEIAFGQVFAEKFPFAYTEKYWTIPPEQLGTSWVGERIFYPEVDEVKAGALAPLPSSKHYITSIRYPVSGGYHSFASLMEKEINVFVNKEVVEIDLQMKSILFNDGTIHKYNKLVSTLPLPKLIHYCKAPSDVQKAANEFSIIAIKL